MSDANTIALVLTACLLVVVTIALLKRSRRIKHRVTMAHMYAPPPSKKMALPPRYPSRAAIPAPTQPIPPA